MGELTLNPLGFSPLWFETRSGHMWESQVLLTDGHAFFSPGSPGPGGEGGWIVQRCRVSYFTGTFD